MTGMCVQAERISGSIVGTLWIWWTTTKAIPVFEDRFRKIILSGFGPPLDKPTQTTGMGEDACLHTAVRVLVDTGSLMKVSVLLAPDGENWTIRVSDNLVGRSDRQMRSCARNTLFRLCTEHNEVDSSQVRKVQNPFGRVAVLDEVFGFAPRFGIHRNEFPK